MYMSQVPVRSSVKNLPPNTCLMSDSLYAQTADCLQALEGPLPQKIPTSFTDGSKGLTRLMEAALLGISKCFTSGYNNSISVVIINDSMHQSYGMWAHIINHIIPSELENVSKALS